MLKRLVVFVLALLAVPAGGDPGALTQVLDEPISMQVGCDGYRLEANRLEIRAPLRIETTCPHAVTIELVAHVIVVAGSGGILAPSGASALGEAACKQGLTAASGGAGGHIWLRSALIQLDGHALPGRGGDGGDAFNPCGAAEGGHGGAGGWLFVGLDKHPVAQAPGGRGGDAVSGHDAESHGANGTLTEPDGEDAWAVAQDGRHGGNANARGGNGSRSDDHRLSGPGGSALAVGGNSGLGATGGHGGWAYARGGQGGPGMIGATVTPAGGDATAIGGHGGNGTMAAGRGGDATAYGGIGGHGARINGTIQEPVAVDGGRGGFARSIGGDGAMAPGGVGGSGGRGVAYGHGGACAGINGKERGAWGPFGGSDADGGAGGFGFAGGGGGSAISSGYGGCGLIPEVIEVMDNRTAPQGEQSPAPGILAVMLGIVCGAYRRIRS